MKIIKKLSEYIEEELEDSEKYILKAMEYKEDWPEVAGTLYMLSLEEMKHMQLIHD
jgi:ferritin